MRFYPHEKLALLVDGANLHRAAQNIGLDLDYGRLQLFFATKATLVTSLYFTGLPPEGDDGFQPIRKLTDWLEYNGWNVIARDKDTDVDLAVAAMELASGIEHFVIATGDSDFITLVEALQRCGRRVTVLSALKAGGVSDELRRAASDFLDIDAVREHVARVPRTVKEAVSA